MAVIFAIPSKRKPEECQSLIDQWVGQGYRVILRRLVKDAPHPKNCDLVFSETYPGWGESINELCRVILRDLPSVDWIVTGGDDYAPDLKSNASDIALQCTEHFKGTFGVMQPTGDRWGADEDWALQNYPNAPAYLDRICGSPWLGQEFCQKMYKGNGPFFGSYRHMFADEELQLVAKKLGVLWQRQDLVQTHHHWSRTSEGRMKSSGCPEWLQWANSSEHWESSRNLFQSRKALGFPGHQPL